MKQCRFLLGNVIWISFMLSLMVGCDKSPFEGKKIIGTATINGRNYKESIPWGWNFQKYPSDIHLDKNYKMFHFIVGLSPEQNDNPSYVINFYISEYDIQFKLNCPYKIDFYKELNVEPNFWDIIPYFSENRDKILMENADGIAYVKSSVSEDIVPLEGEFVLESINSQTNVCHGYYSFTSSEDTSEKLVINGKFETMTSY